MKRVILLTLLPSLALAQGPDPVSLASLHAKALATDARQAQRGLLDAQSRLRRRNFAAELRPGLTLESHAQYQSDVAELPVNVPGAASPPHDTYDARLSATQRLWDPTRAARRVLERAQLAEAHARLETTLSATRQQVNDAFFAALRAQEQAGELRISITDLEAQLRVADVRVREGVALPGEALALRAELLRRTQLLSEADANRRAALDILGALTGETLDSAAALAAPALGALVAEARQSLDSMRVRPEFRQFDRARDLLAAQQRVRGAQDRPRVSAFGRAGYGQPGLNPLNDSFDSYWLAGVQLQWAAFDWGTGSRDREVLALQRQIVEADERAFADQLRRAVMHDLATIDRLEATLAIDEQIIAIRERIAAETRARYAESVVTSADLIDRQSAVLGARINRAIHRTELSQARARVLATLGIEVR